VEREGESDKFDGERFFRNSAKVTLRVRSLCAILCNSERVLNVIRAAPGLPKSEFCAIAFFRRNDSSPPHLTGRLF
jgi:hypothetical protein